MSTDETNDTALSETDLDDVAGGFAQLPMPEINPQPLPPRRPPDDDFINPQPLPPQR